VVAFPSPWEPARKTAGIGVAIACGAVAMWYLPLFAAVMRMRFMRHEWPSTSELSSALPWSASAVSAGLLSAVALTLAARATDVETTSSPAPTAAQKFMEAVWPITLVASAAFSVASIALHYRTCTTLAASGLDLRSGPAGSVLFGFAMLDLAAMAVAAVALAVMSLRLAFGRWHPARPLPSVLWSVYLRCAACIAALGFLASFLAA
jgi:heme/copper-type cytochrome/quinol oxidase subunit 3